MYTSLTEQPKLAPWKAGLAVFLPSLVCFVALDVTWIWLVASGMYKHVLGDSLRSPPGVVAGILAWICIVGTVYLFALPYALPERSWKLALQQGAVVGTLLYGTFEFTNLSIIKSWTWGLAFADLAWGGLVCAIAAVVQLFLYSKVAERWS